MIEKYSDKIFCFRQSLKIVLHDTESTLQKLCPSHTPSILLSLGSMNAPTLPHAQTLPQICPMNFSSVPQPCPNHASVDYQVTSNDYKMKLI